MQPARPYKLLAPRLIADGNETADIATPEVTVPPGTCMGWNLRGPGHAEGEACNAADGAIPFALTEASRSQTDPRQALSTRYAGRADYLPRFKTATQALVAERLLLPLDAEHVFLAPGREPSPLWTLMHGH